MKLKLADDEQRTKYWNRAKAWSDQQDWDYYQKDAFASNKGIAEFLANQDGYTVFESYVGREYEKV